MLRLLVRLNDLTELPLAITPAERWRSARPTDMGSNNLGSIFIIAMVVLGVVFFIRKIEPRYKYRIKGIDEQEGKPMVLHMWI